LEKVREDSGKSQNFFLVMTEFFSNNNSTFFRKEIENHATLGICFWFFSVAIFPAEVFVMKLAELQNTITNKLFHRISDHQTQLALFKHCVLLSTIQHFLATQVYHNLTQDMPTDLHHWNSPATTQLHMMIQNTFTILTKQTNLPTHVIPIIHLPALLCGIGI
jgi:hypothetical protein